MQTLFQFILQFDALCGDQKSLGERLGVTPESAIFSKPKTKFFDDLSDDEEYQNMTEEERNEKMKPKFDLGEFLNSISFLQ